MTDEKNTVQSKKRKSLCSNMEPDPTFHFYRNK